MFPKKKKKRGGGGSNVRSLRLKNVLFSLLMYIIITIYGRVKKSVMPLFIFWIIFLLDLELNFIDKLLVFRWELIVLLL